eukprot:g1786.t1
MLEGCCNARGNEAGSSSIARLEEQESAQMYKEKLKRVTEEKEAVERKLEQAKMLLDGKAERMEHMQNALREEKKKMLLTAGRIADIQRKHHSSEAEKKTHKAALSQLREDMVKSQKIIEELKKESAKVHELEDNLREERERKAELLKTLDEKTSIILSDKEKEEKMNKALSIAQDRLKDLNESRRIFQEYLNVNEMGGNILQALHHFCEVMVKERGAARGNAMASVLESKIRQKGSAMWKVSSKLFKVVCNGKPLGIEELRRFYNIVYVHYPNLVGAKILPEVASRKVVAETVEEREFWRVKQDVMIYNTGHNERGKSMAIAAVDKETDFRFKGKKGGRSEIDEDEFTEVIIASLIGKDGIPALFGSYTISDFEEEWEKASKKSALKRSHEDAVHKEESVAAKGDFKRTKNAHSNCFSMSSPATSTLELAQATSVYDIYKKYERFEKLGSGTFGKVYRGRVVATDEPVAIKKIRLTEDYRDGIHVTAIREMKFLRELSLSSHPNIIKMYDIYKYRNRMHLVFEFCHTTLEEIIYNKKMELPEADLKSYMEMLLKGVAHCHDCWILHRDLKPNNLMLGKDNQLKLIDFGCAKTYASPGRKYASEVVTLWYRSPELLFGSTMPSPGLDMWSIGCIFAEVLNRDALLKGKSELDQLTRICRFLGPPNEKDWPGLKSLSNFVEFERCDPLPLECVFPRANAQALDLLSKFFIYDPAKRISAKDALNHPYFKLMPTSTKPEGLVANKSYRAKAKGGHHDAAAEKKEATGSARNFASTAAPVAKQLSF